MLKKFFTIVFSIAAVAAFHRAAQAQVEVHVGLRLPTIRFEVEPVLVEVEPGVRVVEDYGDEVFFVDNWYWYRDDGGWYRTRNWHGGWERAEYRHVPARFHAYKRGHYRHYRAAHRPRPAEVRHEQRRHDNGKHKGKHKGRH